MRRSFFLILFFICIGLHSQSYELGFFAGGTNYTGDVGRTTFIAPSGPAIGGLFKWNKSKRYAWRASVIYGEFVADDSKSSSVARQQRGYKIKNSLLEVSAGIEFNFVEYNLHKLGPAFTPYLYTGLTYFRYDYNYFAAGELQDLDQRDGAMAIPMTIGFKYRLSQFFIIGGEVGARWAFTDNLDGSYPEKSNVFAQTNPQFGDQFDDDWYVFSGITLTYTFGRIPCGDCFE